MMLFRRRPTWLKRKRPPLPMGKQRPPKQVLRIARRHIGCEIDNVLVGELLHHRLHQGDGIALASPDLDIVELANEVIGAASGKPRHIANALVICAMTDRALDRLPAAARSRERLAFLDAAGRDIVDKAIMLVPEL